MSYTPYKPCVGSKYSPLPKLYSPFVILMNGNLCNYHLLNKNKISFINQIFSWFYKSSWGYKMSLDESNMKNNLNIVDGSNIILCMSVQKAAFKNLLVKLNYKLMDYNILKSRQYVVCFSFLFLEVNDFNMSNDNIFMDMKCYHEDKFKIFFMLNCNYMKDFNNMLYYYDTFVYNKFYNFFLMKEIHDDNFLSFNIKFNLENNDFCDMK